MDKMTDQEFHERMEKVTKEKEEELTPIDHALLWLEDAATDTDMACERCMETLENEWDKAYLEEQRTSLKQYYSFVRKHLESLKLFIDSKRIREND